MLRIILPVVIFFLVTCSEPVSPERIEQVLAAPNHSTSNVSMNPQGCDWFDLYVSHFGVSYEPMAEAINDHRQDDVLEFTRQEVKAAYQTCQEREEG